jgi:hypothetical protein
MADVILRRPKGAEGSQPIERHKHHDNHRAGLSRKKTARQVASSRRSKILSSSYDARIRV